MKLQTSTHGGGRLANKLKQIRERLHQNSGVLIGLPAGSGNYEDGAPLAVIGAVQEFGSADGHIPERSFLRVPLRQNVDSIKKMFQMNMSRVMKGEMTMYQAMDSIGGRAAGFSKEAIESGIGPANADSTVKSKGSSKPLIDSGQLAQSITHVVED